MLKEQIKCIQFHSSNMPFGHFLTPPKRNTNKGFSRWAMPCVYMKKS